LLANFFQIISRNISKFIPEDYYVASLLANFLRSPIYGQLACQFFSNHQYFQVCPRRLLCGQLAGQFFEEPYKWPACLPIFSKSFQEIFRNLSPKIIMWPACLPFFRIPIYGQLACLFFSKSLHEIFRNLSPKIYYMASLLTIFHIS